MKRRIFPPPVEEDHSRSRLLWSGFLLAAAVVAFGPALHGGFLWDDDVYVSRNVLLTASDGLRRIWFSLDSPSQYFPLTYTTFRLERFLWGLDTFGYHLVNLALHAANAFLVWSILDVLEIPGGWLAAGIFLLHPVQVESVSWITERKNVLSSFFYLGSLRYWAKSLASPPPRHAVAAAFLFYVLALFSKTTACTLPAAMVLVAWIAGKLIDRKKALQVGGFLVAGVVFGLFTVWWEKHVQHASGAEFRAGAAESVLIASRALWFYIGKILWPTNLSFSYPRWSPSAADPIQWLWPLSWIAVCGASAAAWVRGRPGTAYALIFFMAALSPLLGFIPLYTFRYTYVADHYQYLACLGLIVPICAAATRFWPERRRIPKFHVASVGLMLALAAATAQRASVFADSEALWRDTLEKNSESWMAYDNLGCVLMEKGQLREAEADFKKSITLHPREFRTHFNLALLYLNAGRRDEALREFDEALRYEPNHVKSLFSSARLLAESNRGGEALARYRRGLALDSAHPEAHNAIGMILARRGDDEAAAVEYRQALILSSLYDKAHNNLANLLLRQNRVDDAIAEYRSALELNPNFPEAHYNLAIALAKKGLSDESRRHYETAASLDPRLKNKPSTTPTR